MLVGTHGRDQDNFLPCASDCGEIHSQPMEQRDWREKGFSTLKFQGIRRSRAWERKWSGWAVCEQA